MTRYRYSGTSKGTLSARERRSKEHYHYGSREWQEQRFYESGLDDSYYEEWMSNPHWSEYNSYADAGGLLSDLSTSLLGTNSNQRNAIQAKSDALAYEAKLLENYRSNKYNSPLAQVSRERQAGLNPNLLGTDGVSDDSGIGNIDDGFAAEPPISDLEAISGFVNPFIGIANTFVSLAQGFQSLKGLKLDNDLKNVAKYQSIGDLADAAAAASITPATFEKIQKLSDEEKTALIAGDSSMDEILDASTKTSSAADEWIKSFPEPSNRREREFLKKAKSEFVLRRNGILRQADSWDAFVRMRKAVADPAASSFAQYQDYMKAALTADAARVHFQALESQLKSQLYDDAVFQSLWKDEHLASLRESIAQSILGASQSNFDAAVIDQYDDPSTITDAALAVKEAFRAKIQEMIAARIRAQYDQTVDNIRKQYFGEFYDENGNFTGLSGDFQTRSTGPKAKMYNRAFGDESKPNSIGKGAVDIISWLFAK